LPQVFCWVRLPMSFFAIHEYWKLFLVHAGERNGFNDFFCVLRKEATWNTLEQWFSCHIRLKVDVTGLEKPTDYGAVGRYVGGEKIRWIQAYPRIAFVLDGAGKWHWQTQVHHACLWNDNDFWKLWLLVQKQFLISSFPSLHNFILQSEQVQREVIGMSCAPFAHAEKLPALQLIKHHTHLCSLKATPDNMCSPHNLVILSCLAKDASENSVSSEKQSHGDLALRECSGFGFVLLAVCSVELVVFAQQTKFQSKLNNWNMVTTAAVELELKSVVLKWGQQSQPWPHHSAWSLGWQTVWNECAIGDVSVCDGLDWEMGTSWTIVWSSC